ncbi:hypothetical protein DY000_02047563 [Brassica cretica]|uniref:RNase H type-1 domain-containing protein n=1 Tax=Brassica cretica TaxID=69181 RepID=A0ABQ7F256_BRACR|nr:hypothetical protein DY000_02047563 [Brassica cretica]
MLFNNKLFSVEEVVTHAVAAAREWLNAQSKTQSKVVAPRASRTVSLQDIVVKTDATWKDDSRTAGLGWTTKYTGERLNFQSATCFVSSPLAAEGLAMREAIKKCKELGLRHIRIESDSTQLIKTLNSKKEPPEIYGIVSDIRIECNAFDSVYFVWIPRGRNSVADRLAKQALALHRTV